MSDELMKALGFLITFASAIGIVYWRFSGAISAVKDELAAHRLHTAESYVTKAGMLEQTAQIMRAIDSVGERLDGVNQRLDRVFEAKPSRRTS